MCKVCNYCTSANFQMFNIFEHKHFGYVFQKVTKTMFKCQLLVFHCILLCVLCSLVNFSFHVKLLLEQVAGYINLHITYNTYVYYICMYVYVYFYRNTDGKLHYFTSQSESGDKACFVSQSQGNPIEDYAHSNTIYFSFQFSMI